MPVTAADSGSDARDASAPRPPNIVLIVDDQHNARSMGWMGGCEVQTPCLDRLAAQSVVFTNAYCNSPVCAPTRHTLYTGLYASEHGVIMNDLPMREGVPTLMARLNEAGYTTANIGKMHNCPYHHRRDFQYVLHHEFFVDDGGISHYAPYLRRELERRGLQAGPPWQKPSPGLRSWLQDPQCIAGEHWAEEDMTAEHWVTEESLRFVQDQLRSRPGQPFFLHASYFPPHHPYRPIRRYARMYDAANTALPPNVMLPAPQDAAHRGERAPQGLTPEILRRFRAHYYGFITQLDAQIGRLLDGLEALGVAENTIVLFMSDHGDMMGEHGLMYKGTMYDGSAKVPMMVRWPGVAPRREERLVMHADVVPTLLRAVGLDSEMDLPGADLAPLLGGDAAWPDRAVYCEYLSRLPYTHLMLRRGAHKLVQSWDGAGGDSPQIELYDLTEDPWELRDLSEDAGRREVREALLEELNTIWSRQRQFMPRDYPALPRRRRYDIAWPANPWQPVLPAE